MKILLTGATGLIGTAIGIQLVRDGHEIVAISRDPESAKQTLAFPATHMSWYQLETQPLPEVDAVVHLAGESVFSGPWTSSRRKKIISSRVESTKSLVKAFQNLNRWPKVWINGSAIGFYGDGGDTTLNESSSRGNGFLAGVCDAWESATRDIPASCRVVKLRTGLVLARHGGALATMLPLFRAGLGGRLGSGKQWMSWIHLDDVTSVIRFCLTSEHVKGAVNNVAPEPVINRIFTSELSRRLKRPALLPVPKAILKLSGDLSTLFLDSQRVVPEALLQAGFSFKFKNLTSALADLLDFQRAAGIHEIFQQQWIPHKVEDIFPFFCDEKNLEALTPPLLNFKVIGKTTPTIEKGTLIDYRLKVHGVPTKWQTKIVEWDEGRKFVDTQLKGPYALWHHTHEFETLGTGTLLTDRVLYKLPLWPFGEVGLPLVQRDISSIFRFRRGVIYKKFGQL